MYSVPNTAGKFRIRIILVLLTAPLILAGAKMAIPALDSALGSVFSVTEVPKPMQKHLEFLLWVPFGAILTSFVRLTLGISVFSLFRPILVALAFQVMGVEAGLAFLILVLAAVALIRPLLAWAPYYTRVPVLLSFLVAIMAVALLTGARWHALWLSKVAYFPIIALCLTCESFAKVLEDKGTLEAVWRATTTISVGLAITGIQNIPGLGHMLVRFPELLVSQTALVLLIGECFSFRLFEGKNLLALARSRPARDNNPSPAVIGEEAA